MLGAEKRPALGITVNRYPTNKGDRILLNLYVHPGSGYVPLHKVPQPDGHIEEIGRTEIVKGFTGKELVWVIDEVKPADAKKLFDAYVNDNGSVVDPGVLSRKMALMQ